MGLNIEIPHEQTPNPYITPELCFSFHYFAIRKMHFLLRAKALVIFPGGYGTLDELFDALTLIQTQKMDPMPVVLVGREYWDNVLGAMNSVMQGERGTARGTGRGAPYKMAGTRSPSRRRRRLAPFPVSVRSSA